ncbi:sporulation membrane protein YtaF [Clostridium beijerinckii]|uniref:Sporulation protein YtaF n=1 Tax=Clostridium beijerinckii TaxID=1520 RepID=A0A9Q5CZJ3_CLOBE|nr:sporulation membrane protein YtaF [Clostridium beijerinckii]AQS06900.1 manganese efflux pump MntP [Clostridium beijerinckii]MBA2883396.1 putative sporulation protein YtaF [Clostridium beijerinckii]MBA2898582.1 putative sporulation protein YtaF [Clostridium beijerinckii]MBA2907983.1 putative sporulation protein YtaF [Clostridium beijerinckii]MBA9013470.1 putative sporulation protein YtaF [Clostridium beijerinckii]
MILILSALLFSLSSNLDNLVIGIAYGIKKIRIGTAANLIVALVTSTGTFLSMLLGIYVSKFLPSFLSNSLGAGIIIILGLYFVIQSIFKLINNKKIKELALKNTNDMIEYAEKSDLDKSGDIDKKEALLVAFALTFNNFGTGVAASVTGVNIELTVILTFIISICTLKLGERAGNHILGKFLGKFAPLISGLLLISLGVIELFN